MRSRVPPAPDAEQGAGGTLYFWVIKVLCTTVGETASDYLSDNVGLGLTKTTFITGALLRGDARLPVPGPPLRRGDLLVGIVLISIVGTQITDNLTDNHGVSLVTTTTSSASSSRSSSRSGSRVSGRCRSTRSTRRGARVLLARCPVHVRARHRRRRLDGRAAERRLRLVASLIFAGAIALVAARALLRST